MNIQIELVYHHLEGKFLVIELFSDNKISATFYAGEDIKKIKYKPFISNTTTLDNKKKMADLHEKANEPKIIITATKNGSQKVFVIINNSHHDILKYTQVRDIPKTTYKYRIDPENKDKGEKRHAHIMDSRGNDFLAVNEDGTSHKRKYKGKNIPPKVVKHMMNIEGFHFNENNIITMVNYYKLENNYCIYELTQQEFITEDK
jgi:hypothetical protein